MLGVCSVGEGTQGSMHPRWAHYQLSHIHSSCFIFFCFCFLFACFQLRVSLCSFGRPGVCYSDQAGLQTHRDLPASVSLVLENIGMHHYDRINYWYNLLQPLCSHLLRDSLGGSQKNQRTRLSSNQGTARARARACFHSTRQGAPEADTG